MLKNTTLCICRSKMNRNSVFGLFALFLCYSVCSVSALDKTIGTEPASDVDVVCTETTETCIQSVINEVSVVGGTVFFKKGEYSLTNGLIMKSNVKLVGQVECEPQAQPSVYFILEKQATTTKGVINVNKVSGVHDIEIKNIHIVPRYVYDQIDCIPNFDNNNCDIGNTNGIYLSSVDGIVIFNVKVQSMYKGVYIEKSKNIKVTLLSSSYNVNCGTEIKSSLQVTVGYTDKETEDLLSCYEADSNVLNTFEGNGGVGGMILGNVVDAVVYKCLSKSHSWDGFEMKNVKNLEMKSCIAVGNQRHGIDIFGYTFGTDTGEWVQGYSDTSVLQDNIVSENYNGFMLQYVSNIGIVNNQIVNNRAKGIMIGRESKNVYVADNFMTGNGINQNEAGACGINIGVLQQTENKVKFITIKNNNLDVHSKSICLRNAEDIKIERNNIINGYWCIQLSSDTNRTDIENNTCKNIKGIVIEDNAISTTVSNNVIQTVNSNKCVDDKSITKQNTIINNICTIG
jgi:parallel beta-helix repeat protein